jgi:hypothetical protein
MERRFPNIDRTPVLENIGADNHEYVSLHENARVSYRNSECYAYNVQIRRSLIHTYNLNPKIGLHSFTASPACVHKCDQIHPQRTRELEVSVAIETRQG